MSIFDALAERHAFQDLLERAGYPVAGGGMMVTGPEAGIWEIEVCVRGDWRMVDREEATSLLHAKGLRPPKESLS